MSQCSDPGCAEFRFDADAALREGWGLLDDEPYCPLHHCGATWRARKKQQQAEMELRAAARRAVDASNVLNAREYAAWDEFQSDLANYHREHGRLAPPSLRMMPPRQWLEIHAHDGRIDVDLASQQIEEDETARRAARDRYLGR
jgi:hypothetical protein